MTAPSSSSAIFWTKDYVTGLIFIVLVAIIWAASSVLVQYLYDDNVPSDDSDNDSDSHHFRSPFAVTYIGVSLFTLWLPTQKLVQSLREKMSSSENNNSLRRRSSAMPYQALEDNSEDLALNDDDVSDHAVEHEDMNHNNLQQDHHHQPQHQFWTDRDHFQAALKIAPVWFVANWTYNASLAYTSITSSTVLASTGSLFTFLFAVWSRDEQFSGTKCAGVLLGVAGSVLTAWQDVSGDDDDDGNDYSSRNLSLGSSNWRIRWLLVQAQDEDGNEAAAYFCHNYCNFWGDLLGLISAVGYGTYAVQTRVLCPKDESLYSMQTLLGYIGLLNLVALAPFMFYQLWSGAVQLVWVVLGFLVVKGLFDNVLSDYLWLRAVMLTNATVATVGLGLTIPLAFVSDVLLGKAEVLTAGQVLGALAVLAGFVLVNVGNRETVNTNVVGADNYDDDGDNMRIREMHDESEQGQEVVDLRRIIP